MKTKVSKAVILNKATISWFSKGSLHSHELPNLLNRPFLDYQLESLRKNGITEIYMLLAGSSSLGQYDTDGIVILRQDEYRGTAGALTHLRDLLKDEPFIVLNASTFVSDYKVKLMLSKLKSYDESWAGAFAVFENSSSMDYSETIRVSENGSIHGIYRSHRSQNRRSNKSLAGFYLLSPKCFEYIPDNSYFDLKEQLIPILIKEGYRIETFHLDHGCSVLTPDTYLCLQFRLLSEALEGDDGSGVDAVISNLDISSDAKIVGNVVFGEHCVVEDGATIIGPVLFGNDCRISQKSIIVGPTVIGHGCEFKPHSWVQNSVLHDRVIVGEYAQVRHSLVGTEHQIADADRLDCIDALIGPLPPHRDKSLVNHEVPQMLRHHDAIANAIAITKYEFKKRVFDIVLSFTMLALSLPLWPLIAAAICLESKGPVFYVQRRCGIHGKEFPMLKFRTMLSNADQMQDELRHKRNEVDGPVFKMSNDPRLTKVGRFLRKTSLDELPQLINVLMGDMSCVGPRPLAIKEMSFNPNWRDLRLMVKPGLTGLWQVHSRIDPRFHAWIEKDIEYVRNQSMRRDIEIIIKTLKSLRQGV